MSPEGQSCNRKISSQRIESRSRRPVLSKRFVRRRPRPRPKRLPTAKPVVFSLPLWGGVKK